MEARRVRRLAVFADPIIQVPAFVELTLLVIVLMVVSVVRARRQRERQRNRAGAGPQAGR
ncbi:hypothetical protein B0G77_2676 [Paraburkholderia sp. BL10I2N1]|nr:hypothetical protein B0G77_2676 [Paraburkholderia sp. BL10I2N1]